MLFTHGVIPPNHDAKMLQDTGNCWIIIACKANAHQQSVSKDKSIKATPSHHYVLFEVLVMNANPAFLGRRLFLEQTYHEGLLGS